MLYEGLRTVINEMDACLIYHCKKLGFCNVLLSDNIGLLLKYCPKSTLRNSLSVTIPAQYREFPTHLHPSGIPLQ